VFYTETDPRQALLAEPRLLDVPLPPFQPRLLRLQFFQPLLAVLELLGGRAHAPRPLRRRLLGLDERLVLIDEVLPAQSLLRFFQQPNIIKGGKFPDLFLG
jgi:hypothetical protein